MSLIEKLDTAPLIADGALDMLRDGESSCVEALCVSDPDRVIAAHTAYISAGSQLIRTNTYAANSAALARYGLERHVNEINWHAAQLARQAASENGVQVMACVGPVGVENPADIFREQLGALLDGGCRIVLLEGFSDIDELLTALRVKHELHHCETICMLAPQSAVPLSDAWQRLVDEGADIVGVHTSHPGAAHEFLKTHTAEVPVAVFCDAADSFAGAGREWVTLGARILGGGRNTTPDHIRTLVKSLTPTQS